MTENFKTLKAVALRMGLPETSDLTERQLSLWIAGCDRLRYACRDNKGDRINPSEEMCEVLAKTGIQVSEIDESGRVFAKLPDQKWPKPRLFGNGLSFYSENYPTPQERSAAFGGEQQ